ncbi:16S rRNA (cytosine(967)-C(5))-methyltransferase RsmB [Panacagrimonas sp.]|uniref:16S rRNA (cytosine(967)-C(5))-methyltransferase RsmB n=1 Tax=Panacagrimonas sp. TaxID=2480088 RepID=UPI003B515D03
MKPTPRSAAALAVAAVLSGRSLDDALPPLETNLSPGDRSLLRALAYGTLRDHGRLAALAQRMLKSSLQADTLICALIEVGLFQLRSLRVSPHAAVNETVLACEILGRPERKPLLNALLRRFQREREALEAAIASDLTAQYSHPSWLIEALQRDWPEHWQSILERNNEQAPMTLRVNRRRQDRDTYRATLAAAGLAAHPVEAAPDALVLEHPTPVERIPGFIEGQVSVQDAAAQRAVDLLQLEPGLKVLDACSAPGGKTAHLLERADVEVLAVDHNAQRLDKVRDTLRRLDLKADLLARDAALLKDRWGGAPFDRILLDAPCSGTGVIRRHPDIKWLRRADDIPRLADQQLRLLFALWPLLAPGGRMLFATCSVLAAEGEEVVRQFFMQQADAKHEAIDANWGEARRFGRRIAPGGDFDGFYFAALRKNRRAAA